MKPITILQYGDSGFSDKGLPYPGIFHTDQVRRWLRSRCSLRQYLAWILGALLPPPAA